MLIHKSLHLLVVLTMMKWGLAVSFQAQAKEDPQLRGIAETWQGEKIEGWIRFDRDHVIIREINGQSEKKLPAAQLKSAHMHLTGGAPQRVPGLRGTYFSTMEFGGTLIERIDPQINFDWKGDAPMPGIPEDPYEGKVLSWAYDTDFTITKFRYK